MFVAACRAPDPQCAATRVPFPEHVDIVPAASTADPRDQALPGVWTGSWDGKLDSRLIVERVDSSSVSVVYSSGYHPAAAADRAQIASPGTFGFGPAEWHFEFTSVDADQLDGTLSTDGTIKSTVHMHRCDPSDLNPPTPRNLYLAVLAWGLGQVLLPVAISLWAAMRWPNRWQALGTGAVTWLLASLFVNVVSVVVVAGAYVGGFSAWWLPLAAISVAAGLSEESLRWLSFRRLAPNAQKPAFFLAAGAAHGATEAVIFAFGTLSMVSWLLAAGNPIGKAYGVQTLLFAATTRPLFVLVHMAFAVVVSRAVTRQNIAWLGLAITLHIAVDLCAFIVPSVFPALFWPATIGPALVLAVFTAKQLWDARTPTTEAPA